MRGVDSSPAEVDEDDPKSCLERWAHDREFSALRIRLLLWHALEQQGFRDVRLRQEPYAVAPNLWWFRLALGSVRPGAKDVERAVRAACASIGLTIEKDFISAVIKGRQVTGGFILPERAENLGVGRYGLSRPRQAVARK